MRGYANAFVVIDRGYLFAMKYIVVASSFYDDFFVTKVKYIFQIVHCADVALLNAKIVFICAKIVFISNISNKYLIFLFKKKFSSNYDIFWI